MRVAIVGIGLIGGSLARDLAAAGHEVVAYDRDATSLRRAKREGIVSGVLPASLDGIETCAALVLAVPVDQAVLTVTRRARVLRGVPLVTDAGSTKASIVRAAGGAGLGRNFVGAHPLAGDHRAGWGASREGLFSGQTVYLTPTARTPAATLRAARRFWRTVGARIAEVTAQAHDRLLASTSHLPQVTSLALALSYRSAGIPPGALGRGGRDASRMAASDPRVWAAILADNGPMVVRAISRYRRALADIERTIRAGDPGALRRLIAAANHWTVSSTDR